MQPEQQQRIMGYFIEEAKDHLNTIEQGLLNLQATIEDAEMANEVFRAAHSVKGGAAMLGLDSIQQTSHRMEDYFKILKESPVRVDRTLESMFLQVFDALQDLLDQLQGPFGLTEDKAQEIMTNVEPVFGQISTHLDQLVAQGATSSSIATPAASPQTATAPATTRTGAGHSEQSALALVFRSDVPGHLRDMLNLFKQTDNASTRQQLQDLCTTLNRIGEQFDLGPWCDLVKTTQLAIANPENSYRDLAPIVIKDLKKGQDLVVLGRSAEVTVSEALQAMLPEDVLDLSAASDLDMLLDDTLDNSLEEPDLNDLFDATANQVVEDLGFNDAGADSIAGALDPELDELDGLEAADTEDFDALFGDAGMATLDDGSGNGDSQRSSKSGPEVGTAELNSLADLFEGEGADFSDAWQEEAISGEVTVPAEDSMDVDITSDFSDLLMADDADESAVSAEGDDLADLFGDALFDTPVEGTDDAGDALDDLAIEAPETAPEEAETNAIDDFDLDMIEPEAGEPDPLALEDLTLEETEPQAIDAEPADLDDFFTEDTSTASIADAEASDAEMDDLFAIADQPDSQDQQNGVPDALDELLSPQEDDGESAAIPDEQASATAEIADPWGEDLVPEIPEMETGTSVDPDGSLDGGLDELDDFMTTTAEPSTVAVQSVEDTPAQPNDDALADLFSSEAEADLDLSDLESSEDSDLADFDLELAGVEDTHGANALDSDFDLSFEDESPTDTTPTADPSQAPDNLSFEDLGFDDQATEPEAALDFDDLGAVEPQTASPMEALDFDQLINADTANDSENNLDLDALIEGDEPSPSEDDFNLDDLAMPEDSDVLGMPTAETATETSDSGASLDFELEMSQSDSDQAAAEINFDDLGFDDAEVASDDALGIESALNDLELGEATVEEITPPTTDNSFDLGDFELAETENDPENLGEMQTPEALSETSSESLLDELDLSGAIASPDLENLDLDSALAAGIDSSEIDSPEADSGERDLENLDLDSFEAAPDTPADNLDFGEHAVNVENTGDTDSISELTDSATTASSPETVIDEGIDTAVQADSDDNFFDLEEPAAPATKESEDELDDFFDLSTPDEAAAEPELSSIAEAETATEAEDLSIGDDLSIDDADLAAVEMENTPTDSDDLDLVMSLGTSAELDNLTADNETGSVTDDALGDFITNDDDLTSTLGYGLDGLPGDDEIDSALEDGVDAIATDHEAIASEQSDDDVDFDDLSSLLEDNPGTMDSVGLEDGELAANDETASHTPESDNQNANEDEFGDLDALLGDENDQFAALEAVTPETASNDVELEGLDALLDDGADDGTLEDNATEDDIGFDGLDALLDDDADGGSTDLATATDSGFDDLDALLDDDQDDVDSAFPEDNDDEFGDLERLLEEADQSLGGSSQSAGLRRTTTQTSRRTSRRGGSGVLGDQTMRVSVKHLDNLSNLVGELVVNRNTLEQDQERLRQFLDNLLFQVQQLNDVGQRMRDLYERSLLESSLISSRQAYQMAGTTSANRQAAIADTDASHSTGATFDALEMDRFTGFHTLSQEMIELIVRVRESSSDIAYTIESSDQVTRQFRQVTTQLQEGLNKARMVPFAQTADRLPRAVRDISMKFGKEARLIVEGRDTLIDKMILEQLYDPMTHLVNNAITHGIETPEERLAAGKSREGTITIRAFYQGNQTVIYVADDGAGINHNMVKRKAMQKGLITQKEARDMAVHEVYELLYHPGFSTRDQADDFAGRGVGMDVVRTYLAQIRGTITTDSAIGKGTSFTIRLPLTLSISKALSCVSNQARIAFPMDGVEDMLDVPQERVQVNERGQSCILWRDTLLPFQPLSELLTFNRTLGRGRVYGGNQDEEIISVVVLRSANTNIALQVDQVIGEQEIVIKQLEGPVPKPVGIAGATVLGDGRVMPIADVLELIDLSMGRVRREPSTSLWTQPEEASIDDVAIPAKSEPTVLIVDDSITVRELLSMSFNKVGYRVEQARDGQEAWEKLRSGLPCDLVFCDIEMPRMDGLELLSRMQKDANLGKIPIAMLTSRGADRHRQMAVDLGANGYFTKPYLEEALLDAAQRMLNGEMLVGKKTGASESNGN